jgi:hypothetical protein
MAGFFGIGDFTKEGPGVPKRWASKIEIYNIFRGAFQKVLAANQNKHYVFNI